MTSAHNGTTPSILVQSRVLLEQCAELFLNEPLGDIGRGIQTARLALSIAETQLPGFRAFALGFLAYLYLLAGDLAEAENAVDQGKKDPNVVPDSINYVSVPLAEGEIALRQGDYERILAVTDDLRQFGARTYIPQALYLQAQALLALGQDDAARDVLQEACVEAEAIGSRRTLWSILFALSQPHTDPSEAERLRQQAQEIIQSIADHIGNPELRASFLNLPHVQEVFEPIAKE
jgi:tetratricopeptide (TPR) repeat protein